MYGLTDDEIAALLNGEFEKFSAHEQALLRLADALVGAPVNVSDELYADLRKHFSEEQLIELAADAAQENFRAALALARNPMERSFLRRKSATG